MAKKKSSKKPANNFITECGKISEFISKFEGTRGVSDEHISWAYDYAIMRLYREFEQLLIECIIAGLNRDTSQFSKSQGFDFPKNLTDEVCEFLILGNGYFDFKGQKDIKKRSEKFLGSAHFLTVILGDAQYKEPMRQLLALRNFAAHDSKQSKNLALDAVNLKQMRSSGSYLKLQHRLEKLIEKFKGLAQRIVNDADF